MKICISAESTVDLSKEILDEYNIKTCSFSILLGDKTYKDGDMDTTEIFDYVDMTGTLPKTSAVNSAQYEEHFNKLLKDYDEVIHISLCSELSSAYNNARLVAEENKHVHVIDSRSLSTGIGLLAIYASNLVKEGKNADEIVELVKKRIPFVQASFVVSTLDYLHKGGRCSSLAKLGAQLLRLRPQIVVKDGKMNPGGKYMGKQLSCVEEYCNDTLREFANPDLSVGFVTHSHATDEMIELCKNKLKEKGFKKIYVTIAGGTISSHCGPKCIGILFINDGGKI
ncbi:MAG: DegV family protein [Bacilli bacterium]|nr:DegV family protein [Bacilli bacterium]